MKFTMNLKKSALLLGVLILALTAALILPSCENHISEESSDDTNSQTAAVENTTDAPAEEITKAADTDGLITLTITDENGARSVYYGIGGLKLSEVMDKLGIVLNTGEKLSEEQDIPVSSNMDLEIYRLHTVNVITDWELIEVTAAGTVGDAINAANVVVQELDTVNTDLNERLYDGMDILIFHGFTEEELMAAEQAAAAANENLTATANTNSSSKNRQAAGTSSADNSQKKAAEEASKKAAEEEASKKTAEEEASKKAAEEEASKKAAEEEASRAAAQEVETYITYQDSPGGTVKVTHYSDGREDDVELIDN